jgi:hypothetical protein
MNPGKPSLEEGIKTTKYYITVLTLEQLPFLSAGARFHQNQKELLGVCSTRPKAINKVFQYVRTILKGMYL